MDNSKTYKYKSTENAYHQVVDDVNSFLAKFGLPMDESNPFVLAVSEAFTNAVIHGNRKNPEKKVFLTLSVNENLLSADIVDEGQGGLENIRQRKPSTPEDEGGRGIDLIEHYATSVGYVETPSGGLRVEIRITRNESSIVDKK